MKTLFVSISSLPKWWLDMSEESRKDYIDEHPGSKYAGLVEIDGGSANDEDFNAKTEKKVEAQVDKRSIRKDLATVKKFLSDKSGNVSEDQLKVAITSICFAAALAAATVMGVDPSSAMAVATETSALLTKTTIAYKEGKDGKDKEDQDGDSTSDPDLDDGPSIELLPDEEDKKNIREIEFARIGIDSNGEPLKFSTEIVNEENPLRTAVKAVVNRMGEAKNDSDLDTEIENER